MSFRPQAIVTAVTLCVTLFLLVYVFTRPSPKIAYVDSMKLINGYTGMTDARKAYQQKATAWKANIDTLTNEVQRQIFKYEKESSRMTAKERELAKELIQTKQQQLADYQAALDTQAQQEDSNMTNTVMTQINAHIKKFGERNNYTIILAVTQYGNIAYADDGVDVTEEVLAGLNNDYSGK